MTSRVAGKIIELPKGTEFSLLDGILKVKGKHGELTSPLFNGVEVAVNENQIAVSINEKCDSDKKVVAMSGTTRALIQNMVTGVSERFVKKLILKGVGYRAQVSGKNLNLSLGFSHPVAHPIPEGIEIQAPSQTEIHVIGVDKQKVGQVAADIRAYRPPEPYKGKGIRYEDEVVTIKETKK